MPPAADFRLYHSNALDVLAGLLAEALRTPAPGASLLAPEVVLIPQVAMRRWLQATLAATHGIAANIAFLTPGEFVRQALDANLGPAQQELDAATLRWHLLGALADPALMARPALAPLAAHVAGAQGTSTDPLRAWALAGELAGSFEKYQAWRRDWLLRWDAGADPDDPQALLWRHVARGRDHRARRIQQYLDRFEAAGGPRPAGLPARLFAFATLNVSPDVLRVLATAARVGPLHLFVPSPVRDYWGDLQHGRRREVDADETPLLAAWGGAGRDFMAVLGGYEVVHPTVEIPAPVDPADGGDTLLRRLQSDLFHRRARPGATPRAQLDRCDPSVQVHACPTRLRELQVLHDQMRGLFEDASFDPPLQPREVAVLAPDIDPYLPYLDAVFARPGQADAIPYALADASPLAGEPLAEVFLRLLALPVSRFGLGETLDLLASPPLAQAAGLEPATLDRLHAWLADAGARWGLDAAHRARCEAPVDDAHTWAFALDRLLLGHATGSDDAITAADGSQVAPLPSLEGGALDALDTLVRLLRVLARQATALAVALPPDAWRERLLGLLDALLPTAPTQPATQRALDRLRTLIDAFAGDARRAGYTAALAPEAVRAHFAAVLGEADTRAPLLTGGVSIGRMVPMRLLPFRVICLLGMDDGAFPRRDAAGGLNRLVAELGGPLRRPGDRSTRDDDRFLFLQLFAAAQDVFYVSYQGSDPRDGSVREPSVLVADLLAAAGAQHASPAEAGQALVVHHPLQPFAPAAFGAGDARRFSYRGAWWPAAAQPVQRRTPLPAWFDGVPLVPLDTPTQAGDRARRLDLDTLRRFLLAPAQAFLEQRLAVRLAGIDPREGDVEPLLAPGRGLARHALQQAVFQACLRGDDDATAQARLRAQGLLPAGALGRRTLEQVRGEVAGIAGAFARWRGEATATPLPALSVALGDTTLDGRLGDAWPHGIARVRFAPPNGPSVIRNGLDWLFARAAGVDAPLVEFHDGGDAGPGPHPRPSLDAPTARTLLARLLAVRDAGLRAPLPFAPSSGWALFDTVGADLDDPATLAAGLRAAAAIWHGSARSWSEGGGDAPRLALRGRDPFADVAARQAFIDTALGLYGALTSGTTPAPVDPAHLGVLAEALDSGDAE